MAQYYDFAGQRVIIPGAYTQRSFPKNQGKGKSVGKVIIMGEAAKGGIPFDAFTDVEDIINVITGQAQALSVFGGGDLYYGAEFFLTPTKDERFRTPGEAFCVVVNGMTQAKYDVLNSATSIIEVAFSKWGTDGNQAAIKVSAGTTTGKLLQLLYKGSEVLNQDNVELPMFNIIYTGSAASATITITATKLTTTCASVAADDLDITLANYADINSLISFINGSGKYTCTLTGRSDESPAILDILTAVDIKTAPGVNCKADVEALIRAINASDGFTAILHAGSTRLVPTNMTAYAFLTGGTVDSATTQDWTDALAKLEKYDCDNIVVMSGSATIHALVNAHCDKMNGAKVKKYRQWGSGSGSAVNTKALRIAAMKGFNSAYAEYCVSPFKRYDFVNKNIPTTDFEPYYLYPMIAGLRYANNIGMDIVFKYLNVISTPEILLADQEAYAEAGATVIQRKNNVLDGTKNFEIVINNTCYQGSQITRTNPAVVYEVNVLTKDFEEQVIEKLRGLDAVANSVTMSTIQNWISTVLFPRYRDDYKWITDSIDPVTGAKRAAFTGVKFYQDGEVFKTEAILTMSVTPRFAFNFFTFITPGQNV